MTTTRSTDPASQRWFDRALLTDPSRCPACAAHLTGARCSACGVSLAGTAGSALWDVSREAAALLDRRDELLTNMRRAATTPTPAERSAPPEGAARPAAPSVPARPSSPSPFVLAPSPGAVPPRGAVPGGPAAPYPTVGARAFGAPPSAPARPSWPLQNVLLGLGALLLAGASIVFLAFTWGEMPLALRATVIAVVTAAVFVAATLAARKALTSSADAIAALGSLLVVLDAWALHATGLVPAPDGAAYAALATLGSAGVLVTLGTALRLDVARAAGCALLPFAPALLSIAAPSASVAALLLLVAVATCSIHLAGFCERRAATVLPVLGLVLLVLTLLVTLGAVLVDGLLAGACVLVLVAAVAHAWSVLPTGPVGAWSLVAGVSQTVAVLCGALALVDEVHSASAAWLAPLGALVGAVSVVLVRHLVPRLPGRASAAAWWTFFVTTAAPVVTVLVLVLVTLTAARPVSGTGTTLLLSGLAGLVVACGGSLLHARLRNAGPPRLVDATASTSLAHDARPGPRPAPLHPVPLHPGPSHPGPSDPRPLRPVPLNTAPLHPAPWFAMLAVLAAGLLLPGLLHTAAYWLVLPIALALISNRTSHPWRLSLRAGSFTGTGLAILLSIVMGAGAAASVARTHGQLTLAAAFMVLMVLLLVARTWVCAPPAETGRATPPHATATAQRAQHPRADLLLAALVVGAGGTGTLLAAATHELAAAWPGASLPLLVLALTLVVLAARTGVDLDGRVEVLSRHVAATDLRAVLAATALVSAATAVATASTPGGWLVTVPAADAPPLWVSVLAVASAVALALLAGVLALGGHRLLAAGTVVVSAAAAPPLAVLAAVTVRSLTPHLTIEWEIIGLVVLAFFPVLAATRSSQSIPVRSAIERSSVVLGTVLLLLVAVRRPADVLTVALVIAASATAAWAFLPGRARAGWFALALGIGASWNALVTGGVGTVEAYAAPGAAAVVAVGAWQLRRHRPAGRPLVLAGSTVLLLPTALLAPTSTQWRPLAVALVLLLLVGGVLVARTLRTDLVPAGGTGAATGPAPADAPAPAPSPTAATAATAASMTTWFLVLGLVAAIVGTGGRAVVLAAAWVVDRGRGITMTEDRASALLSDPTSQPVVWILVAAVAVCALSWLLGLEWPWLPASGPRSWAAGLTALVITVPVWALTAGGVLDDVTTTWTVLSLLVLWGAVALLGTPPGVPVVRTRTEFLRRAVPPLVVAYVVVLGLSHATDVPVDVLLTVVGLFVAVVGVRAAVVEPTVPTWANASYGVFATLAPVTVALMNDPAGWRAVLGVLAACTWLLLGLRARWQAPVAVGGAALVLQVVVLVGPLGLAALTGVPGWVVLAVTGLVLLTLGLTYERQITTARATLRRYAELR